MSRKYQIIPLSHDKVAGLKAEWEASDSESPSLMRYMWDQYAVHYRQSNRPNKLAFVTLSADKAKNAIFKLTWC